LGAFDDNDGMTMEISDDLIARQTPEAQAIIRLLLERIRALEERLGQSPANSSLPPSSQHPHAKPPRPKTKSRRRPGGQPGHPKHDRPLLEPERCDLIVPLRPEACRRCGTALAGDDPQPLRHQVWEVPEIRPHVTEYQRHRLACPCCGERTCAPLPIGVSQAQAGPRLVGFAGLLMAYFRQSKRRTAAFLSLLLGQPCSPAWVLKLRDQLSRAVQPACAELAAALPQQPRLGIDESPTKQGKALAWLWVFVAAGFTVFALRLSRARTVLDELLKPGFAGVVNCDRAKVYWSLGRLQWCWAHLKRDFQALADSPDGQVKRLGHDLLRQTRELFRLWARCRDGTLARATFQEQIRPLRRAVEELLLRGLCSGNPRLVGMCDELWKHRQWLWTFVMCEGVEPTNNASERALRHAVIWRKLSFGTQSASGSRFVERLLSVIETCRQQSRNVFAYVVEAVKALWAGQPTPSLLPGV
jgi:transposase